jgi:hypothetical protein
MQRRRNRRHRRVQNRRVQRLHEERNGDEPWQQSHTGGTQRGGRFCGRATLRRSHIRELRPMGMEVTCLESVRDELKKLRRESHEVQGADRSFFENGG